MGCMSDGARRAATQVYRRGITGADSVDLSSPLPVSLPAVAFNAGLQPNPGATLIVSPVFLGNADTVDLVLVNWGRAEDGTQVALSRRTVAQIAATPSVDSDGHFYGEEIILPVNAPQYELRVSAVSGEVTKLRAWSY